MWDGSGLYRTDLPQAISGDWVELSGHVALHHHWCQSERMNEERREEINDPQSQPTQGNLTHSLGYPRPRKRPRPPSTLCRYWQMCTQGEANKNVCDLKQGVLSTMEYYTAIKRAVLIYEVNNAGVWLTCKWIYKSKQHNDKQLYYFYKNCLCVPIFTDGNLQKSLPIREEQWKQLRCGWNTVEKNIFIN